MATADYGLIQNYRGFGGALKDAALMKMKQQQMEQEALLNQAKIEAANSPFAGLPANMREYGLLQQMPKEQQTAYMDFLRSKTPNYGGEYTLPTNIPQPDETPPVKLPPVNTDNVIEQPQVNIPTTESQAINPFKFARQKAEQPPQLPQQSEVIDIPKKPELPKPVFYQNARGEYNTKGAPAGMAWADINGVRQLAPIPGSGKVAEPAKLQYQNTLRKEFNNQAKTFVSVQDAYSKIKKTSSTGAGDMSMLYAYVKLLDPTSVVRESEFESAAKSGSFGQNIANAAKRIAEGGYLAPEMRQQFLQEADNIYSAQKENYDRLKANYSDIAVRNGLEVKDVVTDYAEPKQASPYKKGDIITAPDGRKGIFTGTGVIPYK